MSANYSGCTYIGINTLSHDEDGKPFDVEFVEADIMKGLQFNDNEFDFIVMKFCTWEHSEVEWKEIIIKELVRCLKPGGWIEVCLIFNFIIFFIYFCVLLFSLEKKTIILIHLIH
jgi:ubiquinone/menaquinone biosynthesis C-methylase UbiE